MKCNWHDFTELISILSTLNYDNLLSSLPLDYCLLFDIISTQLLESELSKTRKNLIKPDIQEDPYTKITFEDGQVLNLKTEKLEYDYMAYIVVRELAERAMIAQSSEETKV